MSSRDDAQGGAGQAEVSEVLMRLGHEIKTPLVAIKGYAELLLDRPEGEVDERTREWARRIASAANRLASLFRRVTAEAHTRSPWTYVPRPVAPGGWVAWCVGEARTLAAARRLEWVTDVPADLPPVWIDPEAGRDLLLELLQNAARATPDGGTIRVRAAAEERDGRAGVRITVEDTGVGLPGGAAAERCFDRFVVLSDVMGHHSGEFEFGAAGLGLGLPMVRGVARAHEGEAWVEGRGHDPGGLPGAAAHVWIPTAASVEAEGPSPEGGVPRRLLVIDPSPEVQGLLASSLGGEYEVVAAARADQGLRLWAQEGPWAGCVVEPRLPEGGGVDLVRELAGSAGSAAVLVYTTAGPGEAEAWRGAGADGCVPKPARARAILQRLETLRRSKR